MCLIAQARIHVGQPGATNGVSTETGRVDITAIEWQMILLAAGERSPGALSGVSQAIDPVPADFATNPA